jgi:small nuclear ribonucleoprotein (snRNP)-like protein
MIATLTTLDVMLNKVVVAYLDGRRLRGRVYDFSPLKNTFRLVPEDGLQQQGSEIALNDLKAVFFVKDFRGDSKYKESKKIEERKQGRKIEVTFSDGEKIVGTTQGYNPKNKGFFLFPADAKSNSLRIFVVNWNVRDVKFL